MEKGLTPDEAKKRLQKYGRNTITSSRKAFSPLLLFLSQFPSAINGLLFAAAVFSFVLRNIFDGLFILVILFINGLFSFFQEYRAQKALQKLQQYTTTFAKAIRAGRTVQIPVEDLTIGDIVILEAGDKIPADGIAISAFHIEVDESILTGESLPVVKEIGHELFRGTFITKGKGYMKIEAIGQQTKIGQIAKTLSTIDAPKTPLQKQIIGLTKLLSFGAIGLSLLLLPIGFSQGREFFPLLLLTISVAVAAIPEGLPGVITVALAVGTNTLAKKQAIVRKMLSVETLGSVQIILTDKTGTLTQNNMAVKKTFLLNESLLPHLLEACLRGNTASLSEEGSVIGDKTDGALLLWVKEKDGSYKELGQNAIVLDEYAFDSQSKMITTLIQRDTKTYAYMRGAPEELLKRSTLSAKEKKDIEKTIADYAKEGLRVIGFGYKKEGNRKKPREQIESDISFLGLLGLYDPPRQLAYQAVTQATNAGVRVIMVTGDNPLTAQAIAKEVGLQATHVLTGNDIRQMNSTELEKTLQTVNVFARVLPEDKLFIAEKLQGMGYIVGVTGDGVNDSLALEKADVGIAMGEEGSDVAKESADIVLTNDDISVLVNAIAEGRRIYTSLVRAIVYLLSGNLSEILFVVAAMLIDKPLALLPTQILWINVVTDALPALALASDTSHVTVGKTPHKQNAFLLSGKSLLFIGVSSVIVASFTLLVFSYLLQTSSLTTARLVAFNVLVISELLLSFVLNRSFKSKVLLFVVGITLAAQIAISTIPFFQKMFQLGG